MAVIQVSVCSFCRREVPTYCDGKVYVVFKDRPGQFFTCKGDPSAGWCLRQRKGRMTYSLWPNERKASERVEQEAVLLEE